GGRLSWLALEQMAEEGRSLPPIEGSGTIYGMYVIEGMNQAKTECSCACISLRMELTLSLNRVEESLSVRFVELSAPRSNSKHT
ncbi:phage tail protein, partial [Escherichia coli]|uniref:phage tail protein n=1 Tax=Escherichia coli TaxID=562 RepID=UPI00126FC877